MAGEEVADEENTCGGRGATVGFELETTKWSEVRDLEDTNAATKHGRLVTR
jgi:hypothetical protein